MQRYWAFIMTIAVKVPIQKASVYQSVTRQNAIILPPILFAMYMVALRLSHYVWKWRKVSKIVQEQTKYFCVLHILVDYPQLLAHLWIDRILKFWQNFWKFWRFWKTFEIWKLHFKVNNHISKFQKSAKQFYYISWLKNKNWVLRIASKISDIVYLPHGTPNPKFGLNWLRIVGAMT